MGPGGRAAGAPATAFRVALLVLCSALSVVADERTSAALPIALLAAFAFAADRLEVVRRQPLRAGFLEALAAGLAVAGTDGAESPMLPYLLAPALAVGLAGRVRDVGLVAAASSLGLSVGALSAAPPLTAAYVEASLQWVLLGLAFGLVAGWAQRLTSQTPVDVADRYAETRSLLEELRRVTFRLPGGLDVPSSGHALLQSCADLVQSSRSAVLVQPSSSGALVPVAVRGTQRVPWRTPLSEPGPLRDAWETGQAVIDRRPVDGHGRRRGSSLLVLPIRAGESTFGLVILEAFVGDAYSDVDVGELVQCVEAGALRLETAVLFDQVRSTVTIEERDRLAREMHDGVAQELAFFGYQLDALRARAADVDGPMAESIRDVRSGLTRLISDIRLSITDLKTSVSSDRGLGAALASYVRAVGSGQGIAVHVTLEESTFRLPGDREVLLFQIAQAVAQDVRRAKRASNLWITLSVDPPSARLLVEHDGEGGSAHLDLADLGRQLALLGGALQVQDREDSGVCVEAVLEGGRHGGASAAGR